MYIQNASFTLVLGVKRKSVELAVTALCVSDSVYLLNLNYMSALVVIIQMGVLCKH